MTQEKTVYHPIIYVRGYAMTEKEINDATVDPFCGFNLGSTVFRATSDKKKKAKKFIFESPLVRLISDYSYQDVYKGGCDIVDADWEGPISYRSIVIYRYYEQASTLLGKDVTPEIETFAKGLSDLILRVRYLTCEHPDNQNEIPLEDFRCYLVAHSMGGLICRAFLQNSKLGDDEARQCVDKVFTYATPHNGIDVAGVNVPSWVTLSDISNFNRDCIAKYLTLENLFKKTKRVDWLPEKDFPSERFFCLVATNRLDYEAAMGLSRTFVGHGSDGLVKIANASVWGVNNKGKVSSPCATAYAYRSHSGHFGIVNGEESYQNLTRFLFGDVRVDIWVEVEEVCLPTEIQGKAVDALYQFEILASPRGKRWFLTRRVGEEDSVACCSHKELTDPDNSKSRNIYLSTVFLANNARVNINRPSLSYSITLGVRIPDYEIDRKFWFDGHYEGGYLFHDSLVVELVKPEIEGEDWDINLDWKKDNLEINNKKIGYNKLKSGKLKLLVPYSYKYTKTKLAGAGIKGNLRFLVSAWNAKSEINS